MTDCSVKRLRGTWMKVADTSLLYARFDRTDPRQADAIRRCEEGQVVIPMEVLVELIGAMGSKIGRAQAKVAVQALTRQPNVLVAGTANTKRALGLYQEHAKLSLVDACVVAACEGRGCGVLTYDSRIEGLVGQK